MRPAPVRLGHGRVVKGRAAVVALTALLASVLLVPAVSATCHTSYYGCGATNLPPGTRSTVHSPADTFVDDVNGVRIEAYVFHPNGDAAFLPTQTGSLVLFVENVNPEDTSPVTVAYGFQLRDGTPGTPDPGNAPSPITLAPGGRARVLADFTVNRLPAPCTDDSTWSVANRIFEERFTVDVTDAAGLTASLSPDKNYLYVHVLPATGASGADVNAGVAACPNKTPGPSVILIGGAIAAAAIVLRARRRS